MYEFGWDYVAKHFKYIAIHNHSSFRLRRQLCVIDNTRVHQTKRLFSSVQYSLKFKFRSYQWKLITYVRNMYKKRGPLRHKNNLIAYKSRKMVLFGLTKLLKHGYSKILW